MSLFQDNDKKKSINQLIKEVFVDSKESFSEKSGQDKVEVTRTERKFDPNIRLQEPNNG